jgi:TolA-binding protein
MSRRISVCVLLFGLTAVAVTTQQPGTAGAVQKVNPQVAKLQQQNQLLQQQNQQLQTQLQQAQADLKKAQKDDKTDSKSAKDAQAVVDGYKNAGLVHVVLLKLKSDSSDDEVQSLIDDTNSQLAKIKGVRGVWAGKPSENGTPDVSKSDYTVALAFVFDDAAGLKKYIDDPAHKKFVDKHLKKWETPVVYDFEPKKKAAP